MRCLWHDTTRTSLKATDQKFGWHRARCRQLGAPGEEGNGLILMFRAASAPDEAVGADFMSSWRGNGPFLGPAAAAVHQATPSASWARAAQGTGASNLRNDGPGQMSFC